jgi:YrbI family 3-deoxy-D-manno-octulosonate 8-phosphate phosphatase
MKLDDRCKPIRLILSDVDGVLTDGRIILDNQGVETKLFHVRDGMGIHLWQKTGYRFGLITLRSSQIVKLRVAELGIDIVRQGVENKLSAMRQILAELRLTPDQACYIGDDLPDLSAVCGAGLGVAVADACDELRKSAHYVTIQRGGAGAVRETIELILKSQNRWDHLIQAYLNDGQTTCNFATLNPEP